MAFDHQSAAGSPSAAPPPPPIPSLPADTPPSIPTRTRLHSTSTNHGVSSRRRSTHGTPGGAVGSKRESIPPAASPEVISSLITSLSGIAKPADDYFEGKHATSTASTPGTGAGPSHVSPATIPPRAVSTGSFGIDYGAYKKTSLSDLREHPVSLDEIAASPPVIRTSKPTSGYSPLSPPMSPSRSPRSHSSRDNSNGGGLRSFIRSSSTASRPSSNDSGRHDDTHSIGNLSIERGSGVSNHELQPRRSYDSWGKKAASRSYKGLMYMTSKERLRDREERRRGSSGAAGASANSLHNSHSHGALNSGFASGAAAGIPSPAKPDPFLAETAIREEPTPTESLTRTDRAVMENSPRPIPHRDSSLRKPTPSGRRASERWSTRDADGPSMSTEGGTPDDQGRKPRAARRVPARLDLDKSSSGKSFLLGPGEVTPSQTPTTQRFLETIRDDYLAFDNHTPGQEQEDDGAPFPAVSQNRRRSTQSLDRRRSAPSSPALNGEGRPKRSSSRLKRLSRPTSPTDRKASQDLHREADGIGAPLERLDSADSIDDDVDSYLCSPRLTQKIKHPQTGRVICFSEVGDPEGSAVFCCVGMGLTRYITAFYDELALTLKLRLITPDRPGVGDSEPYPDGTTTPLNWPDDVYAICQTLKITKFSILAHSAGAIYALATALRMPQHIRGRIHLLAPWIPPSQMNVFGGTQNLPPTHAIPTSQRILRALPTPMLKVANSSFMSATSTSITTSLPKNPRRAKRKSTGAVKEAAQAQRNITPSLDKENVNQGEEQNRKNANSTGTRNTDAGTRSQNATNGTSDRPSAVPAHQENGNDAAMQAAVMDAVAEQERQMSYDTRLTHAIWELATTGANPAVDLLICLERRHTIGFRYVDINRPVTIHHGSRDTRVPVDNVRWLGKTMRRCEVRVLEGEGHGLMASASVMGSVLMEISKEWEDWMRVTGADGRKDKERERGRRGTIHR